MLKNKNQKTNRHCECSEESNRHCEQSEAIWTRLPRATALAMTNETGRSMVEMLGVLAVIGVLSITGISGYTTAMNKHRANEILDAASKRAVAVSTQLQSGRTTPTLAEFGDDNTVAGATFSTALETQGSDKFVIKFTSGNEPSAEIWAQMQNIAGTSGIVRAYESGRTGLVYNNDLTTDPKASDYNGNQNGCTGASKKYCTGSKLCVETTVNCNTTCTRTDQCKSVCDSNGSWSVGTGDAGKSCKLTSDSTTNDGVCSASGVCAEASKLGIGETCTNDSDCASGNCSKFEENPKQCTKKGAYLCNSGEVFKYKSDDSSISDLSKWEYMGDCMSDDCSSYNTTEANLWVELCNIPTGVTYFCSINNAGIVNAVTGDRYSCDICMAGEYTTDANPDIDDLCDSWS